MGASADAVRELPELGDLDESLDLFGDRAEPRVLATVSHAAIEFPIVGVVVGAAHAEAPTLALKGAFTGSRGSGPAWSGRGSVPSRA